MAGEIGGGLSQIETVIDVATALASFGEKVTDCAVESKVALPWPAGIGLTTVNDVGLSENTPAVTHVLQALVVGCHVGTMNVMVDCELGPVSATMYAVADTCVVE